MSGFVALVDPPADPGPGPGRWYLVNESEVLVGPDGEIPSAPPADLVTTSPLYMGTFEGRHCWAVGVGRDLALPDGYRWEHLRSMGQRIPREEWMLAGRAVQLVAWLDTHRFCGRCGHATVLASGERATRCPNCGLTNFPRLAPAVIVLVHRGDQVLLGQGRNFTGRMFSALAGFVEPGETLEEAAIREVKEETGVDIADLTYFDSQPWPFPHSLMIGFHARWVGGDIVVQPSEIVEARWFSANGLPELPPPLSIARRLIESWLNGVGPAGSAGPGGPGGSDRPGGPDHPGGSAG
jgi:NAD+ diphosphatase